MIKWEVENITFEDWYLESLFRLALWHEGG